MTRVARLAVVIVLVVIAGFAVAKVLQDRGVTILPFAEECVAAVGKHRTLVSVEQGENAALITSVAIARGLPARAATIALATAYQESGLRNLDHGDRDSLGLFQQRPSQGWGSEAEIMDPLYATNKFYDALVKLPGYETMVITKAAQAVQRSAFPEAYAKHEPDARALASALTGNSRAAFWCNLRDPETGGSSELDAQGLTKRAARVLTEVRRRFPGVPLGGFEPGGVTTGHMAGSAHYEGRAIDMFVRPISADNKRRGWAIASYFIANASRLNINTVIFDDRIWKAGSTAGWREYDIPSSSRGDRKILEHRDHVHINVAR